MKARSTKWIIGIILIAVAVVALKYTVFFDAKSYWNELVGHLEVREGQPEFKRGVIKIDQSWYDENVKRFHKGDPPCLRYVNPESIDDKRVDQLAQAVEDGELLEVFEQHGYFNALFYKWRMECTDKAHELGEPEEMLAAVSSGVGWSRRLLIWLNKGKLISLGKEMNQGAASLLKKAAEQQSTLSSQQLEQLRGLWSRFAVETTPLGLLKLTHRLRPRITVARMKHIGRAILSWTGKHASPPQDLRELVNAKHLTDEQIKDGWHMDIQLEHQGNVVRLVSLGADRREGGTGKDKDIAREFKLTPH